MYQTQLMKYEFLFSVYELVFTLLGITFFYGVLFSNGHNDHLVKIQKCTNMSFIVRHLEVKPQDN